MVYQTVTETCNPSACSSGSCICDQLTGKCKNAPQ
jgi:hypothetical protein